jgi:hypothetical protein
VVGVVVSLQAPLAAATANTVTLKANGDVNQDQKIVTSKLELISTGGAASVVRTLPNNTLSQRRRLTLRFKAPRQLTCGRVARKIF